MGKARRKEIVLLVTVSVPAKAMPSDIRGVVRLAIANGLSLNRAHTRDTKLKSVKPAGRILAAAKQAWEAWGGGPRSRAKRETPPLLKHMGVE